MVVSGKFRLREALLFSPVPSREVGEGDKPDVSHVSQEGKSKDTKWGRRGRTLPSVPGIRRCKLFSLSMNSL